jgi:hypothetical protein
MYDFSSAVCQYCVSNGTWKTALETLNYLGEYNNQLGYIIFCITPYGCRLSPLFTVTYLSTLFWLENQRFFLLNGCTKACPSPLGFCVLAFGGGRRRCCVQSVFFFLIFKVLY